MAAARLTPRRLRVIATLALAIDGVPRFRDSREG